MEIIKYSEILALNRKLGRKYKGNDYPIGIVSNITVNQLKEIFEYFVRREGINATCTIGNYDNIVQDSAHFHKSKLVIIFWELANLIEGFQYKADLLNENILVDLIQKTKAELNFVFENLKETPRVIINSFSSLIFNLYNLNANKFDDIADELNNFLIQNKPSNFTIVNTDKIIAQLSVEKSVDFRFYYSSKALYTIDFYKRWSHFVLPLVRSLNGKTKKALIFDCDNTLWKGVLGEEGFNNILLSETQPGGAPYEEVQSIARQLANNGIILGLCSKNNSEDVEEVLSTHPLMTLKDDDFTIKRVNWTDKVTNLERIAESLNIGKDSLVLVDDSDFEINFVNESLPEVFTIQVPKTTSEYPNTLRKNLGLFYNVSKTTEDAKRVEMYKEQVKREEVKSSFENLESYIKSLGIVLEIHDNDEKIIPRMSQMTQKTNQFNLTTKRYSEVDIRNFVKAENYMVIAIGVKDKYGDNGLTGLTIIKLEAKKAEIDTLLLSCRIIGRHIELRFFDFLMEKLKKAGIIEVRGKYFKTNKNAQVFDFFDNFGFELRKQTATHKEYLINLEDYKPSQIDYIHINHGG